MKLVHGLAGWQSFQLQVPSWSVSQTCNGNSTLSKQSLMFGFSRQGNSVINHLNFYYMVSVPLFKMKWSHQMAHPKQLGFELHFVCKIIHNTFSFLLHFHFTFSFLLHFVCNINQNSFAFLKLSYFSLLGLAIVGLVVIFVWTWNTPLWVASLWHFCRSYLFYFLYPSSHCIISNKKSVKLWGLTVVDKFGKNSYLLGCAGNNNKHFP